jgi:hypothetical protein
MFRTLNQTFKDGECFFLIKYDGYCAIVHNTRYMENQGVNRLTETIC